MTALPPDLFPRSPLHDALADKWAALCGAARVVAGLAGETPREDGAELTERLRSADGARRAHAEQALDDLTAIMAPGLAALLAAHGGGATIAAAARALGEEFAAAYDGLLAVLGPEPDQA